MSQMLSPDLSPTPEGDHVRRLTDLLREAKNSSGMKRLVAGKGIFFGLDREEQPSIAYDGHSTVVTWVYGDYQHGKMALLTSPRSLDTARSLT
jgi:hypothetical protein